MDRRTQMAAAEFAAGQVWYERHLGSGWAREIVKVSSASVLWKRPGSSSALRECSVQRFAAWLHDSGATLKKAVTNEH